MRRRDRVTLAVGATALVTSVLVVGSVLRWTQALVAGLVALALLSNLVSRRKLERIPPIVALLGAAAALTAIQLIPLPASIVDIFDPVGNHLRMDGAELAHTQPWMCLSLDPAGSLRALAFFVTLIGVAVLAVRYAAAERERYILLAGVALTCGLAAAVTGAHTLVSADSLYGLYTPVHVGSPTVFGPLLNSNHMGCLMAIGAVLSLALAFYDRQAASLRVLWIVIGLGCVAVAALSLSRGAVLGMLIGFAVAGGILVARRLGTTGHTSRHRFRANLPLAVIVSLGVAIALYASAGNVANQIQDTSISELNKPISKYAAWKSSVTLIRESPWVGIGRGAVETNLTRVHPESAYFTFSHLENEYLSAVVEWGVPGALILAAAFGWCIFVAARRWRDGPLAAGAIGALSAVVFQSSVDFGIELFGIAVPVTIIASTVQLTPLRQSSSPGRTRIVRGLLAAAITGLGLVLLSPATTSVQEDHDAIAAQARPDVADVRAAIQRHPLDYFGFGTAADVASTNADPHAADLLNHALRLHPTHPGLHRLAARMLVGLKNYRQAAIEYSLALNAELAPRQLLNEIVTLIPNPDDIAAAIPTDYYDVDVMLRSLHDIKRPDVAMRWLARVARRPQHDLRVIDTLYDLAMARKDYDVAKSTAELRWTVAHTTASRLQLAKVELARQEYDVLLKDLADVPQWSGRLDYKASAWFILCDVHIARRDWNRALECVHRLDASGLVTNRIEITKRLQTISEQRTYESKMEAAKALERAMGSGSGSSTKP